MKKTILIVDDEEDNRVTIKKVLEKNGFSVATALNGDDCLQKLSKQKADLVLLDVMMPGLPVKEIINRIKDTKIAFITVVRTSEAERENLLNQKNVVGFIQKPFDINELVEKVRKMAG